MGATAVGVAAAAPGAIELASSYAPAAAGGEGSMPLVAYLKDASKGQIAVMVGTKEVVVTDFGLVSRLLSVVAG